MTIKTVREHPNALQINLRGIFISKPHMPCCIFCYQHLQNMLPFSIFAKGCLEIHHHINQGVGKKPRGAFKSTMKTFAISFLCSPSKIRKKTNEAPIEISISCNGERVCMQLGKYCDPSQFQELLHSKKQNDIKTFCETYRQRVMEIQTQLIVQRLPVSARSIKGALLGEDEKWKTLKEIANEYLLQKTGNPAAYAKYKNTFARLYNKWGADKYIKEITPQAIVGYKTELEKTFKQSTLRSEMKRLKSLFTFAFNSGYLDNNPFSGLRFTFTEDTPTLLTYEEVERIRDVKLPSSLDQYRNFFLFLCFSGLEYADAVNLSKEDVRTNRHGELYIKKPRVKTGVEYISILYEDADELWRLTGGDIEIKSNQKTNAALKQIAAAAGIEKSISTLSARHFYASFLLSKRLMPAEIVQKMLGHTSLRQTYHYSKMLPDAVFDASALRSRFSTAGAAKNKHSKNQSVQQK